MKHLFTSLLMLAFLSCSKDSDNDPAKDITLQVLVEDKISQTSGNHCWAVRLYFLPSVIIQGSLKVDYDTYYLGAFKNHYTYTINFSLNNTNNYFYQTDVSSAPPGQGWEVKNIVVSNLTQTSGNYNITLK